MNNANKLKALLILGITVGAVVSLWAQHPGTPRVVRITGTRFSYPLLQSCIDSFAIHYPDIQVIIEQRSSTDPDYDILIDGKLPNDLKQPVAGGPISIALFPVLPIANAGSSFAKFYSQTGVKRELISTIYFHNPFADRKRAVKPKAPFTVYTRLQAAPAAQVFAAHYGFKQADISGKQVAGSDEHQVKAVLRDTAAISYAPLALIYNPTSRRVREGLAILPVDADDNGKLSDQERIYDTVDDVIRYFEQHAGNSASIPAGALVLNVKDGPVSPDTFVFIQWMLQHIEKNLHDFGFVATQTLPQQRDSFLNSIISLHKQ